MEKGGVAMIGLGESDSDQKAQDSVKSALRSPLLDVDISGAKSALVNVTGGNDMSIEEAEGVVEQIYDRIDPDARIIWGTSIDESLDGTMRTMIVVTGVQSPQIYGRNEAEQAQAKQQQRKTSTTSNNVAGFSRKWRVGESYHTATASLLSDSHTVIPGSDFHRSNRFGRGRVFDTRTRPPCRPDIIFQTEQFRFIP